MDRVANMIFRKTIIYWNIIKMNSTVDYFSKLADAEIEDSRTLLKSNNKEH